MNFWKKRLQATKLFAGYVKKLIKTFHILKFQQIFIQNFIGFFFKFCYNKEQFKFGRKNHIYFNYKIFTTASKLKIFLLQYINLFNQYALPTYTNYSICKFTPLEYDIFQESQLEILFIYAPHSLMMLQYSTTFHYISPDDIGKCIKCKTYTLSPQNNSKSSSLSLTTL